MIFYGLAKKRYETEEQEMNRGGEGFILRILDDSGIVAKIFLPAWRTAYRYEKLLAMMNMKVSAKLREVVTWPEDILCDEEGNFAGYIMRKAEGMICFTDLVLVPDFSDLRCEKGPIIAENLCRALWILHWEGIAAGDLNPGNILVGSDGRVLLIDADSFHIHDRDGRLYRCSVMSENYLATDLQRALRAGDPSQSGPGMLRIDYSRKSDDFVLALLLFQLYMGGIHPFQCRVASDDPKVPWPTRAENIENAYSPFFMPHPDLAPPVGAPSPKEVIPPRIYPLLKKALTKGLMDQTARPSERDYLRALGSPRTRIKGGKTGMKLLKTLAAAAVLIFVLRCFSTGGTETAYQVTSNGESVPRVFEELNKWLSGEKEEEAEKTPEEVVREDSAVEGFLFPDSDIRHLDEQDIESLRNSKDDSLQHLLRQAVNEIYARHGCDFTGSPYEGFFDRFDWYQDQEKCSSGEARADMNEIEGDNINFLVEKERSFGFRT